MPEFSIAQPQAQNPILQALLSFLSPQPDPQSLGMSLVNPIGLNLPMERILRVAQRLGYPVAGQAIEMGGKGFPATMHIPNLAPGTFSEGRSMVHITPRLPKEAIGGAEAGKELGPEELDRLLKLIEQIPNYMQAALANKQMRPAAAVNVLSDMLTPVLETIAQGKKMTYPVMTKASDIVRLLRTLAAIAKQP